MKLTLQDLKKPNEWIKMGYEIPDFDIEKMRQQTKCDPFWIHFGAGNIFKAFQAAAVNRLLCSGQLDRGIIVAEGYDSEIIDKVFRPHDNLSVLVTLKSDGSVRREVIASVADALALDSGNTQDFGALREMFSKPSLQIASFTITEKGYSLTDSAGRILPEVQRDYEKGYYEPISYIGKVTALLYARYLSGAKPVAMVSMDNCSHNGDRLREAVLSFAGEWTKRSICEAGFYEYAGSDNVSFPCTMIDKITPRPDPKIVELLKSDGLEDIKPVVTAKNTYVAPFVTAEECEYLVIEDVFPNGRPELEKCGFIFTDRKTVDKTERMKVCTCLNPLHTALAVFGCLLGFRLISDEMKDPDLRKLVEGIGLREGLPAAADPGIIDPREFIETVINIRLPNPFMPDTPQRIASDTSQKLGVRFGETIKAYSEAKGLSVGDLRLIPLTIAGWLRYLTGIDDSGREFKLSPDPMLDELCPIVKQIGDGTPDKIKQIIKPIISNTAIFGIDLCRAGLADIICNYLHSMMQGNGSVRKTLKEVVN